MVQHGPRQELTRSETDKRTPSRLSRRGFAIAGGAGIAAIAAGRWFNVTAETGDGAINVTEAHAAAIAGDIVLVDIRRPDEWARTGVGAGAIPLDMRDDAFIDKLHNVVKNDRSTPVALICARGVRSRGLAQRLRQAGFTHILDVPEGMLGSGAGPGWLRAGLPVVAG